MKVKHSWRGNGEVKEVSTSQLLGMSRPNAGRGELEQLRAEVDRLETVVGNLIDLIVKDDEEKFRMLDAYNFELVK